MGSSSKYFSSLFTLEKKPKKGLFAVEWVIMGYLVLTTLFMLLTYVKLQNPESMLWGRFRVIAITAAMWGIYRLVPCRLTRLFRIVAQMALLSWWYPDTYELNRILPNLDHVIATWTMLLLPRNSCSSAVSRRCSLRRRHLGSSLAS